jgi:cytoskeletal protein RodZ
MNEELPEPLNRVSSTAAPRELRQRTLAAVSRELTIRRKPRWERLLERAAVVLVVIGVGLNVWQASQPDAIAVVREQHASPAVARQSKLHDRELEQSLKGRMAIRPTSRDSEPFGAAYQRLLAEVSKQPAG